MEFLQYSSQLDHSVIVKYSKSIFWLSSISKILTIKRLYMNAILTSDLIWSKHNKWITLYPSFFLKDWIDVGALLLITVMLESLILGRMCH